jgi:hypothetical protein
MIAPSLLVAAAVALIVGTLTGAKPTDDYIVNAPDGLVLRVPAEEAAAIVSARLTQSAAENGIDHAANVISVSAVPAGRADLLEPNAGRAAEGEAALLGASVWWVVRAEGVFVPRHLPPGVEPRMTSSGYYIVDGNSGEIWGMGTP